MRKKHKEIPKAKFEEGINKMRAKNKKTHF
jgi:hypothetical protein